MPPLPVCNKRTIETDSPQNKVQGTQEVDPSSLLVVPYEEKKKLYVETLSFFPFVLASVCPSFRKLLSSTCFRIYANSV
jgi:hypothetical protein